jgi:protein-S-isoprenylcysteine O-methyltransferase Ste14
MALTPIEIYRFTLEAIFLCWMAFAAVFLLRKKPPTATESRRDPISFVGMFLQGCAFWIVWGSIPALFHRTVVLSSAAAQLALSIFSISLAIVSVWLVGAAIRTLGKQWAIAARLIEGHRLVTNGPYRLVRNPIYTGMFGMLVATGLAFGHWIQLMIAIVLFAIGLVVRVRSEEKLLRSAFGQEFEDYARHVPAVLPGIF